MEASDNTKSFSVFTSYNYTGTPGKLLNGNIPVNAEYDAALLYCGGNCRIPTQSEYQELLDYADWTWDSEKKGYIIPDQNNPDNKIFLYAAGNGNNDGTYGSPGIGHYWTSTYYSINYSYDLRIASGDTKLSRDYERNHGFTIRAVKRGPVLMSWVDLGLESGTLWSETNLNASSATEYGLYYQFGSTTGHDNSEAASYSTWSTAPSNGGSSTFDATSWNAHKASAIDSDGNLKQEYDAAYQQTYGLARTPTQAQIEELCALENEWTNNYNSTGVHGRIFHGNNGETLFIPAAGCYYDGNANYVGQNGVLVWSRTVNGDENARYMYSWDTAAGSGLDAKPRYYSYPIRPVKASGE